MKNSDYSENNGQSEGHVLCKLEPWDELVDGALLLNELTAAIRQYVVLEDGAAEAIALWVLHTHAHRRTLSARPSVSANSSDRRGRYLSHEELRFARNPQFRLPSGLCVRDTR